MILVNRFLPATPERPWLLSAPADDAVAVGDVVEVATTVAPSVSRRHRIVGKSASVDAHNLVQLALVEEPRGARAHPVTSLEAVPHALALDVEPPTVA